MKGQDAYASDDERKKANERLEQLINLVNRCLIRRTSNLLSQYLPPKTEQVVCIKMNEMQTQLYQHLVKSDAVRKTMKGLSISNFLIDVKTLVINGNMKRSMTWGKKVLH